MEDYYKLWNFPNCCGAMDGKLINIRCPGNSGSDYFDYKRISVFIYLHLWMKLQFLFIDVGTNGRANDASVFQKSTLNEALMSNLLNFPEEGVIVADDAFPLRTDILKPFNTRGEFGVKQKIFNYRLSRARRVVENTFGILVSKFRIFEKPIPLSVEKVEQLVKTTCALHNWLRKTTKHYVTQQSLETEDWNTGSTIPGDWRQVSSLVSDSPPTTARHHSENARRVRNAYAENIYSSDTVVQVGRATAPAHRRSRVDLTRHQRGTDQLQSLLYDKKSSAAIIGMARRLSHR
ncbi:Putative nuclease HARBI1 [Eumeta japonica]|uniref:Nuclease HARBI1 n=1 Tax=Eumeta variegata TaxID=151549 RepID=A0A4C1Y3Z1_EUMVA|nr:Putative nuclease HARBI1 [Eumeta japonica]